MTKASGSAASQDKAALARAARAELKRRGKTDAQIEAGKRRACTEQQS